MLRNRKHPYPFISTATDFLKKKLQAEITVQE